MEYQLAQINLAKMLAAYEDPIMADFIANLDRVYDAAYESEGFVWMIKDEDPANLIKYFKEDLLLVNLSVWENTESLFNYVYKSVHGEILKRKKEWFGKMPEIYMALWYVPKGHKPTETEAAERLIHLQKKGETPFAFSFKKRFTIQEFEAFSLQKEQELHT